MSKKFVITGTDTDIGKTVFSAGLVSALGAYYWKPVQAGLEDETDSQTVARLSGMEKQKILPETYRLKIPASPHYSAEQENIGIQTSDLPIPAVDGPLIIEGAGGALVPVNQSLLFADLFAIWALPTIIVASTQLGTINHSLMTIEALRSRKVSILGIAFIGEEVVDSQNIICKIGNVKQLGRLPIIENLSQKTLLASFKTHFNLSDFQ